MRRYAKESSSLDSISMALGANETLQLKSVIYKSIELKAVKEDNDTFNVSRSTCHYEQCKIPTG